MTDKKEDEKKEEKETKPEEKKERITFPTREHRMIVEEKIPPKTTSPMAGFNRTGITLEDEDEELEIPAFIRRKMGK